MEGTKISYGLTPLHQSFAGKIQEEIQQKRKKYADYHKTVFHIHTPASYDYRLYEELTSRDYKKLTDKEMYDIAVKEQLFHRSTLNFEDITHLSQENKEFDTTKEFLSFLLIAKKLMDKEVKLVAITDHNTIAGFNKLTKAIELTYATYPDKIYPEVGLGIEISCADKCHVVGVFNDDDRTIQKLNKWISTNIMDYETGTYHTSLAVLKMISNYGGIGYIAHINSSDIFKDDFLSGGYKKQLFKSIDNKLLGVSDLDKIDSVSKMLKNYTKDTFYFVLDEDSHCLNTLATKPFWIKGQKVNFNMLKNAIVDFEISTEFKKPEKPNVFIKGLVIDRGGFLSGKEGKGRFSITFSESLNCFIGGRGTGKSTILNIINFALSQNVYDEITLENICKQGNVYVVCSYDNEEYYILFNSPKVEIGEYTSILEYFNNDYDNYRYDKKYKFDKEKIKEVALKNYIQIFKKVVKNQNEYIFEITRNKKNLLANFFYKRYSVNELVRTSSTNEITHFIQEMLFKNEVLSDRQRVGNITTINGLKRKHAEIPEILNNRKQMVHSIIGDFNREHAEKLKISYSQNNLRDEVLNWREVLGIPLQKIDDYFESFNIINADIIDFFAALSEKSDPINVFIQLINKNYNELSVEVIYQYAKPMSNKLVEEQIREISPSNIEEVIDRISEKVHNNGLTHAVELLKNYLLYIDKFDLKFNINNMESNRPVGKVFKSVKELSLGQKVVAMLSFILSYSDYSNDYTPLIIDQPEDNLDNRYIYRNLVSDLRNVKSKRQVILATHNSTIVTNSKAEQVIVLASNNKNGWVDTTGYPTEKSILTHIVNLLEGGVESFKHKHFLYQSILNKI